MGNCKNTTFFHRAVTSCSLLAGNNLFRIRYQIWLTSLVVGTHHHYLSIFASPASLQKSRNSFERIKPKSFMVLSKPSRLLNAHDNPLTRRTVVYHASYIMDSLFTLFSLYTNINSPASRQAASRQAAQTSAAASAARSKVSILLRASTVSTLSHRQA